MFCPSCGTPLRSGQKFCVECGTSVADLWADGADRRNEADDDRFDDDDVTGVVDDADADADGAGGEWAATTQLDDLDGDADTGGEDTGEIPLIRSADEGISIDLQDEVTRVIGRQGDPMLRTEPGTGRPEDRAWRESVTGAVPTASGGRDRRQDADATVRLPATTPFGDAPTRVDLPPAGGRPNDRTEAYSRPYGSPTAEQPVVRPTTDWEWNEPEQERRVRPDRRFHFRVVFLPALLAVAAAVLAVVSTLIEIRPDTPTTAFETGSWMVNDFGTNNTVAAILAMVAVFGGALLWCFGFRWGAGLAGGGGLALAGWAALLIGLVEWPLSDVERLTGGAGVVISRNLGYWALLGAGGLGVLVFLASLTGAGRDRQGGLDPWIAALGAASVLVAAGGPLIPLGDADISGNYNSSTLAVDLPDYFFAGRLVQLGLFAFAGIIGFLLVRRFGLGLAIGGATVAGFQLATAATAQTTSPIGPGYANPGAGMDLAPHGVTVVGMALAAFFALVALVMALLDSGD